MEVLKLEIFISSWVTFVRTELKGMKITKQYIESFLSERGGYTKANLAKLGVDWPPQKGWKKRLLTENDCFIKKPKSKKTRSQQNKEIRKKLIVHFGLHEFASNAAVCFCIHQETNWQMPERKSKYPRYMKRYFQNIGRPKRTKKTGDDFYKSQSWKETRFIALRLSDGTCELCGARASDGVQLHVDHIKPRSRHPELELDLDNLQILCEDCNFGKSNYDDTDFRKW